MNNANRMPLIDDLTEAKAAYVRAGGLMSEALHEASPLWFWRSAFHLAWDIATFTKPSPMESLTKPGEEKE